MRYSIRTVGPVAGDSEIPAVIALDDAKAHLRVDFDTDDALIAALLAAAQDHVEKHVSHSLTPRQMELALSGYPSCSSGRVELPIAPVTEILGVAHTDASSGEAVALDAAEWRWSDSAPGQLLPAFGGSWPTSASEWGAVRILFVAGYEEGLAPASLVAAVKLLLGHLYTNRESVVTGTIATELPLGVTQLCAPYRRIMI